MPHFEKQFKKYFLIYVIGNDWYFCIEGMSISTFIGCIFSGFQVYDLGRV